MIDIHFIELRKIKSLNNKCLQFKGNFKQTCSAQRLGADCNTSHIYGRDEVIINF